MAISHGSKAKYGKGCYPKVAACIETLKFDAAECGANGDTALFLSIENRHELSTIFLIENGQHICKHNICGETMSHPAGAGNGYKENVKLLIVKGIDLRDESLDLKADPNLVSFHPE